MWLRRLLLKGTKMKTEVVRLRLTPEDKKNFEEAAEKLNMSVSEYIRNRMAMLSTNILSFSDGEIEREEMLIVERQNTIANTNVIPRKSNPGGITFTKG